MFAYKVSESWRRASLAQAPAAVPAPAPAAPPAASPAPARSPGAGTGRTLSLVITGLGTIGGAFAAAQGFYLGKSGRNSNAAQRLMAKTAPVAAAFSAANLGVFIYFLTR